MIDRNISGERVVLTGGTTGIGRATVAMLAKQGAHVLTFGRISPASTRPSPARLAAAAPPRA